MRPSAALDLHRETVRELVAAHKLTNPRVFGSVVDGDDTEDSDLDLLVDPIEETSLFDVVDLHASLEALLQVKVDVLTPRALSRYFRDDVLRSAVPI